ncbi:helix-turn-helix transcriptional regulator [Xanthomonas nasturtii]|uniref:helix-turn-helix transcriptional regulator n=1 Tax=Xanthomonas nasturtii TaxID=1843581 RepID=UPI00137A667F|nr:AlpA family phage regulatory protein [Xanthomonas nasturtii]WVL56479.1 AlpA family phage regulatory protein [Xanthomonas nasturtii]
MNISRQICSYKLLSVEDVATKLAMGKSTIWAKIKLGSPRYDQYFPKPIRQGPGRVAWIEHEVDAWVDQRIAERDFVKPDSQNLSLSGPLSI